MGSLQQPGVELELTVPTEIVKQSSRDASVAALLAAWNKAVQEHRNSLAAIVVGTPPPDPWNNAAWQQRVQTTIVPVAAAELAKIAAEAEAALPAALAGFAAASILAAVNDLVSAALDDITMSAISTGEALGASLAKVAATSTDATDLSSGLEGIFAAANGRGIMMSRLVDSFSNAVSQGVAANEQAASDGTGYSSKTWQTMEDDLVRPEHALLDGVSVAVTEDFDVGGEAAQYPGDPNLSDAMAANCRCSLAYE